jgi:hypothetical protein
MLLQRSVVHISAYRPAILTEGLVIFLSHSRVNLVWDLELDYYCTEEGAGKSLAL